MMKGLDCPLRSFQCFCNTARRTAARKQQERRSFFPSRSGILKAMHSMVAEDEQHHTDEAEWRKQVMSAGGLSRARLSRMHDVMAGYVERGEVPGLVTLVSRRGEVHVDAIGTLAVDGGGPVRHDTIFRISSMTKPVTAVATMILVEECKLRIDDPVDGLLPELSDRKVLTRLDA